MVKNSVFYWRKWQNFVVFNDQPLSFEPISDADIADIEVRPGSKCESKAWSCNAEWYFVIRHHDIICVNVHTRKGLLCRKKSARFIEAFIKWSDEPKKKKEWARQLGLAFNPL